MTQDNTLLRVEGEVIKYYLNSSDFNGISMAQLSVSTEVGFETLRELILEGVRSDRLRLLSSDHELNPHIIREGFKDEATQATSIRIDNADNVCIYPSRTILKKTLNGIEYRGGPYSRMLAEGRGKLEFVFFDLQLLNLYKSDPRYYYECDDIGGRICIQNEYYKTDAIPEKDQVLLKSFGFAYDDDLNRFVAAFIGDIADLSLEHQNIWNSKQETRPLKVHPDFYRMQILGEWPIYISVFDAVLQEQRVINAMAMKIGKLKLFKTEYFEDKPNDFSFILLPTVHEYDSFVLLLDKLISDNINKQFFKGDIELSNEIERKDGKVIVSQKGTIILLDEWLRKNYRTDDWESWDFASSVFKEVRHQRQSPAHRVNLNQFDKTLIKKQRDLMQDVYKALKILRCALANHPKCKSCDFGLHPAIKDAQIWMV